MKYLIFLDIDGTVRSSKGIHPRTVNAIAKARALGHKVFINTGRSYCIIPEEIEVMLELDGIVCGLGACIVMDGKFLLSECVSKEDVKTIMDFAKRHSNRVNIEGENYCVSYCGPCFLGKEFEVFSYENMYERYPDIRVSKFAFERRLSEEEKNELSDHFVVFNHPHYAEVGIAGYDKATGMRAVSDILGIDDPHFIAMGDSYNDIEMLEAADIAVVMGNSPEDMKENADFVTLHCDEGGVGYAIEKLLLGE
ncbi:MAG: HAD family phosphatase [Clostridia bacterium]|nr:HAD family phosphatase [Clostridia bacterium]